MLWNTWRKGKQNERKEVKTKFIIKLFCFEKRVISKEVIYKGVNEVDCIKSWLRSKQIFITNSNQANWQIGLNRSTKI